MDKKYGVMELQGHQYRVSEGKELEIDRLDAEEGEILEVEKVFLVVEGEKRQLGTPHVKGAEVKLKVLEHLRGKKLQVLTYKAKSRYRRRVGHRSLLTKVKVVSI